MNQASKVIGVLGCLFLIISCGNKGSRNQVQLREVEESALPVFSPLVEKEFSVALPDAGKMGAGKVKIQIFPHLDRYTAPMSRESKPSVVAFTSADGCFINNERVDRVVFDAKEMKSGQVTKMVCPGVVSMIRDEGLNNAPRPTRYTGEFLVLTGEHSAFGRIVRVIQNLDFEEYLKGVVPAEMPATWNYEAVKAQAVAARTYGLWVWGNVKKEFPERDFDMDDTVLYQAYMGLEKRHEATSRAVEDTRGEVLEYAGDVIKAYFHADSGGLLEDPVNVWGDELPYLRAKKEVYELERIKSSYRFEISDPEFHSKLQTQGVLPMGEKVDSVQIRQKLDYFPSGRTKSSLFKLRSGKEIVVSTLSIQSALRLKSSWYQTVTNVSGTWVIQGRGFGHGVGMNQWGARVYADDGWSYRRILAFYYNVQSPKSFY